MVRDTAISRLKNELKDYNPKNAENDGFELKIDEDNLTKLEAVLNGAPDTLYEGGKFLLSIDVPREYPFQPPKVKFTTKIWHPNVSSVTGCICLDILNKTWAASMTLRVILVSIQALLSAPVPDDPQDAIVASMYTKDRNLYNKTARFWTHKFAGRSNKDTEFEDFEQKINDLKDITGKKDEIKLLIALSNNNWDTNNAFDNTN
ncbi:MAG: ubiquitin-conjugating enzyme E2 K [Paramarteilia canceri]